MAESTSFLLPRRLFKKGFGLATDFGSSTLKVAYTSQDGDDLRFHVVLYARDKLEESLKFIEEVATGKMEEGTIMYGTGVGTGQYKEEIAAAVKAEVGISAELGAVIRAFKFLSRHLPWDDLVHATYEDARLSGITTARQLVDMCPILYDDPDMIYWKYMDQENTALRADRESLRKVNTPFMVYLAGSASGALRVHEDGRFELLNVNSQAGRTFLGLGAMLTGAQSFEELIDLAKAGDNGNIDVLYSTGNASDEDEMYKSIQNCTFKLFAFGHVVGKRREDFKKEDLAAAVVSLMVKSMAVDAFNWARSFGTKQVFFVGGFTSCSDFIREEITKEFTCNSYCNPSDHACECYFVKNGAHMGAFGVLMKTLQAQE